MTLPVGKGAGGTPGLAGSGGESGTGAEADAGGGVAPGVSDAFAGGEGVGVAILSCKLDACAGMLAGGSARLPMVQAVSETNRIARKKSRI